MLDDTPSTNDELPMAYVGRPRFGLRVLAIPLGLGVGLAAFAHAAARLGFEPYQMVVLAIIIGMGLDFERLRIVIGVGRR